MLVYFADEEQYREWVSGATVTVSSVPIEDTFKKIIVSPIEVECYRQGDDTLRITKKY